MFCFRQSGDGGDDNRSQQVTKTLFVCSKVPKAGSWQDRIEKRCSE